MPSPLRSVGSAFIVITMSGIASMRPVPKRGVVMRRATTVASGGITSGKTGWLGKISRSERRWMSGPPRCGSSLNTPLSTRPIRVTRVS